MKYSEQLSKTVFKKKRKFGVSWVVIPYGTNKRNFPTKSGVYMFIVNEDIMYVGSTNYLPMRMQSHSVFYKLRKVLPDVSALNILFTPMERFENSKFELRLIHLLRPKYNYAGTGNVTEMGVQFKKALNGRPLRWLSLQVGIPEGDLSKKVKEYMDFTDEEISRINEVLKSTIKK